jgi:hypothetical protein
LRLAALGQIVALAAHLQVGVAALVEEDAQAWGIVVAAVAAVAAAHDAVTVKGLAFVVLGVKTRLRLAPLADRGDATAQVVLEDSLEVQAPVHGHRVGVADARRGLLIDRLVVLVLLHVGGLCEHRQRGVKEVVADHHQLAAEVKLARPEPIVSTGVRRRCGQRRGRCVRPARTSGSVCAD